MKLKTIANVITSKVGRQILIAQKHSPVILFGAGVVGVVVTVVLASKATLKLNAVLDEHEREMKEANFEASSDEEGRKNEIVVYARTAGEITRMYAPSVVVGILSIAALTGSHVILSRRNVALTAAYAALDRGFREYRDRVRKDLGEEKDLEYRHGKTIERDIDGEMVQCLADAHIPSVYARFFDESSPNWNKTHGYNVMFIQCQQNYANDLLRARGHVFLNEIYDMLGLPRTKEGAIVGWLAEGCEGRDGYIDFGVFEGDRHSGMRFVLGHDRSILLDFNVDGIIYDKI